MSWYNILKGVVRNLVFTVPVTVTFLDHVGYIARVEGTSMQPSLNPIDQKSNDYVFLNKWAVRRYEIKHGDIIALICPKDPDQKLIKRVIAKEGDSVKTTKRRRYVLVPSGHLWVEGDHLTHSMDSNFFGPVSLGLVTARASHIVWPPSRWQKLASELSPSRTPLFDYRWSNDPMLNPEDDD